MQQEETNYLTVKHLSSISAINGSLTGIVKQFIINKFSSRFFKTVHLVNSAASVVEATGEDDTGRYVKPNPALSIDVRYTPTKELKTYFPSSERNFSFTESIPYFIYDKLPVIFDDDELEIQVKTDFIRIKLEFDIAIRLETEMEAWDIGSYLSDIIAEDRPFFLNSRVLSCQVPNNIARFLAETKGLDLSKPDSNYEFSKYVKTFSRNGFELTKNASSGSDVVFFNHPVNVLSIITTAPSIEKVMKDNSNDGSTVSFSMSTEVTVPKFFVVKCRENKYIEGLKNGTEDFGDRMKSYIVTFKANAPETYSDLNIILFKKFITEKNEKLSEIDLNGVLPKDVLNFMSESEDRFSSILVWFDEEPINAEDYIINRKKSKISLFNTLENLTYHLAVYIDLEEFKYYMAGGRSEFDSIEEIREDNTNG